MSINLTGMSYEQLVEVTQLNYQHQHFKSILELIRLEQLSLGDQGDASYISMIDAVIAREKA